MLERSINEQQVLELLQESAKRALKHYAKMSTGSVKTLRAAPTENVLQVLIASDLAETRLQVECEVRASVAFETLRVKPPDFPNTIDPRYDIVGFTKASGGAKYFIEVKATADLGKLETEHRAKLAPTLKALKKAGNGRVVVQVAVTEAFDSEDRCLSLFGLQRGLHADLHGSEAVRFVDPDTKVAVWIGVGVYKIMK
jgi:hypothetical protein